MKIFSIVTPTYNSEKTLRLYFEGIIKQDYDLSKVEILIVDGGSTDKTLEISNEYLNKIDVRIIKNPQKLPEYAVVIGINEAVGTYCAIQGSDEVLTNKNSFNIREEIFDKHLDINTLILTKLSNPEGYSKWGEYYNCIGDPFSSFVYGAGFSYLEKFRKYYDDTDYDKYIVCYVKEKNIMPLIDSVQTFRRNKLFELLKKDKMDVNDVSIISSSLIKDSNNFAVIKNDEVLHYSSSSFKQIIKKIYFRIINNVYGEKSAGFINRQDSMPLWYKRKKFLFIPYSLLILPALYDSIVFSIKTKNIYFMAHVVFSFYTGINICWNMFLKILGVNKKMKNYG